MPRFFQGSFALRYFFRKSIQKAVQGVTIFGIYFQFLLKTKNSLRSNSLVFLTQKS